MKNFTRIILGLFAIVLNYNLANCAAPRSESSSEASVKYLVDFYKKIGQYDRITSTPLHLAILDGRDFDKIKGQLHDPWVRRATNKNGDTPLEFAKRLKKEALNIVDDSIVDERLGKIIEELKKPERK